jgi:hypothetical protein
MHDAVPDRADALASKCCADLAAPQLIVVRHRPVHASILSRASSSSAVKSAILSELEPLFTVRSADFIRRASSYQPFVAPRRTSQRMRRSC